MSDARASARALHFYAPMRRSLCALALIAAAAVARPSASAQEALEPATEPSAEPEPAAGAEQSPPQTLVPRPPASRAAPPRPTPAVPVDSADIERQLRSIYSTVDEFAGLEAEVEHGVVRLSGTTSGPAARERAVELARGLPGVVYVDDDIDDAPAVEDRVEPMLARARERGAELLRRLPLFALGIAVLVPFWLAAALLRRWDAPFRLITRKPLARSLVQRTAASAVLLIGIALALDVLGIVTIVGAVLGAAGVLGIAIGFAFRNIIENYLASILLGLRRPFAFGDHVTIAGHQPAVVVGLNTRETLLMTYDGNHLSLPNAIVFRSEITNLTRNPVRRLDFTAGIGPASDLAAAQRVGVESLQATPGVLAEPPPFARVEELGDSAVLVRFHAWIDQRHTDWYKARSECVRRVKLALEHADIELPEPTYRVKLSEADRPAARAPSPETPPTDVSTDDYLDRQVRAERSQQEGDLLARGNGAGA